MHARVVVTLKTGILDPQGKAIEGALASLGIGGIGSVRQGKVFDIELESDDLAGAEASVRSACEKLLANTVIENFRIEMDGRTGTGGPGAVAAEPTKTMMQVAAGDAEMPTEGRPSEPT